ncbi:MAG: ABC transporter permease [Bacteroidales bacterium]|jgi:ABC-type antimicrobial peptide transport system permease subunit|nr:ABC transporter permease [Bacteroidales bacterium]
MQKHYLKIVFRNLWKYKERTSVGVVSMAMGFTFLTVTVCWIRYETTFDNFIKNADRIYSVYIADPTEDSGLSRMWSPPPLAAVLRETFPEISNVVAVKNRFRKQPKIEVEGIECQADLLQIDSSFFTMFAVSVIDGNMDFLIPENQKMAVTDEKARQLFGNENPVGKVIKLDNKEYTVGAVVSGLPKHSNYPFDFLYAIDEWGKNILIELYPAVDAEAFRKKLYKYKFHTVQEMTNIPLTGMTIVPITAMHYEAPDNVKKSFKFQHIIVFAISGSLIILCALFNYLTLFVNRIRIRKKEFTVRKIFGASDRSLFVLLSVEFIVVMFAVFLLGMIFIYVIFEPFRRLSEIDLELSSVYFKLLIYISAIILILLIISRLMLIAFKRGSRNIFVGDRKPFRKISVVVQLIISIVFAFCAIITVKQMHYIHNSDLGFDFKNRAAIRIYKMKLDDTFENHLRQIPEITETVTAGLHNLLPNEQMTGFDISEWDDKPTDAKGFWIMEINMSVKYESFYAFQLLEGEMLLDDESKHNVLINESAVKLFGWNEPVGKSFYWNSVKFIVKGVLKDIYNHTPATSAKPILFNRDNRYNGIYILFKYMDGTWDVCKNKIERMLNGKYPEINSSAIRIFNSEEEYDKFFKPENALLNMLTFAASVCVIICISGFVSTVSLTCEERRREIAIRKINGATVKDILDIFFKEYLTLLAAGALIAFPVGYYIMKRWLEQYVIQTEINAWIYLSILLILVFLIVVCVGKTVYKASRENPVEILK